MWGQFSVQELTVHRDGDGLGLVREVAGGGNMLAVLGLEQEDVDIVSRWRLVMVST